MDEEKMDTQESLPPAEGEETSKTSSEESAPEPDKKDELINNYKIRAERAEKELKSLKSEKGKETHSDLSTKDVLYLAKADIHEDDLGDVLEWAKFKKISVGEAHKALKGTFDVRNEERKTAAATNTGTTRPSTQVSGEAIEEKARKGQFSEKDEDIDKMVEARMQAKLAQLKK